MFIVIEGIDRSGKTLLIERLKEEYPNFIFTREPGGLNDKTTEAIRKILKDSNITDMDNMTEVLLFAASRNQHNLKIRELLDNNKNIISDRYIYSSLVYQGIYKKIGLDTVKEINNYTNLIKPDLIIYLRLDDFNEYTKRGARNDEEGGIDRIENDDEAFFDEIKKAYDVVLKDDKKVITIDATLEPNKILEIVKKIINQ